ncbi:MAG: exostosin family protein [Anaerolineae bacterium]
MKPLKIYTDLSAVPRIDNKTYPLIPLLRVFVQNFTVHPIFQQLADTRQAYFELTDSPAEADVALLPSDWRHYCLSPYQSTDHTSVAHQFVEFARKYSLPVLVFYHSDSDNPVPLDAIVFRTNLYASHLPPKTLAYPSFTDTIPGPLEPHSKSTSPVVGFCGNAHITWKKTLKHAAKSVLRRVNGLPVYPDPSRLRTHALQFLSATPGLKTNYVLRSGYYGGAAAISSDDHAGEAQHYDRIRAEYLQNMTESDYVPCIRGAGNYSLRFYETMRGGRIPIFINTDCVLPYREFVDWKSLMVWVEQSDIARIGERVLAFHNALSPNDYVDLQARIHQAWEEWLSPHGFYQHLPMVLEQFR